jgi:MATE family multidrug resistance protein
MLAWPLVIGQLLTISMNVVDTMLAGHLGQEVLAAVTMGYPVWVVALLIVIGVLLAVTPAVAQRDGAGKRGEVGVIFRQALWIAVGLGVVLFFGLRHAEPLLALAGVDAEIVPEALRFLDAISWGAPAIALLFTCKNTSDGLSLTRPMMLVSGLGVIVLLPVAWVLMYGKLGIAPLGAAGAGYAHATVMWMQALTFLTILRKSSAYREARLFERFDPPDLAAIRRLLAVGVPMGVAIFMEGTLFVVTALVAGSFGKTAASAHGIAINIASVTFMVPLGIAMATTVRVGNAVGRRDAQGVAWAGGAGCTLAFSVQTVAAIVLFLFPVTIASLYTEEEAVLSMAVSLVGLAAIFQLSDGVQALFNGALRGLEDVKVPALITIVAYWGIGMPVGLWLGKHQGQGPTGLWMGLIAGLSVAGVLLCTRFVQQARRLLQNGFPPS